MLTQEERGQLVLAMLADVLDAVHGASLDAFVLSPDPQVIDFARARHAVAIGEEPSGGSLNRALEWASSEIGVGAQAVLVLLPDVPLATADELRSLMDEMVPSNPHFSTGGGPNVMYSVVAPGRASAPSAGAANAPARMVVATDRAGLGSNALLVQPMGAIPMRFGRRSLARHLEAAALRGIPARVCQLPGLALDVDTPRDVAALLLASRNTRTERLLCKFGVGSRVGRHLPTAAD